MINIWQLNDTDSINVLELFAAQPPEYIRWFHPFPLREDIVEQMLDDHMCWSMTVGDLMIAFWFLRNRTHLGDMEYGILVDHEHRNKGIGRLALHYTQTVAKILKLRSIHLTVYPENSVALRLYAKAGFYTEDASPDPNQVMMRWYRK